MIDAKTSLLIETYARNSAFNCAVGLIVASLGKTDKMTTAVAFVIHGLIADIFNSISTLAVNKNDHPTVFYSITLLGNILIDVAAIGILRQLLIIGDIGTAFFLGNTFFTSADRLNRLIKHL